VRKYKVEKRWTTKAGLRAVIVKQPGYEGPFNSDLLGGWFKDGWYCGYVGVPVDHPAYAKNYDDVPADVHGWLTFGRTSDDNYPIKTKEKLWWFGYDCAHLDDDIKIENLIYNINECELLARQLASIKSKQLNN
jgi:hypothetical protein